MPLPPDEMAENRRQRIALLREKHNTFDIPRPKEGVERDLEHG